MVRSVPAIQDCACIKSAIYQEYQLKILVSLIEEGAIRQES
jgi:hypothetical protein